MTIIWIIVLIMGLVAGLLFLAMFIYLLSSCLRSQNPGRGVVLITKYKTKEDKG